MKLTHLFLYSGISDAVWTDTVIIMLQDSTWVSGQIRWQKHLVLVSTGDALRVSFPWRKNSKGNMMSAETLNTYIQDVRRSVGQVSASLHNADQWDEYDGQNL